MGSFPRRKRKQKNEAEKRDIKSRKTSFSSLEGLHWKLTWCIASAYFWVSRQKAPCFLYCAPPLPMAFELLPQSALASVNDGFIWRKENLISITCGGCRAITKLRYISTWIRKVVGCIEEHAWLIAIDLHGSAGSRMNNTRNKCKRLIRTGSDTEVMVVAVARRLRNRRSQVEWQTKIESGVANILEFSSRNLKLLVKKKRQKTIGKYFCWPARGKSSESYQHWLSFCACKALCIPYHVRPSWSKNDSTYW